MYSYNTENTVSLLSTCLFSFYSALKKLQDRKNIFNRITRESVQPIRALCVHESDARKPDVPTFGLSLLLTNVGSLRNLLLEIKSTFVFA